MTLQLTGEMKENHRFLSDTNLTFLDYVRQNPGCLKRANFDDLKWDELFTFQPWPTFVGPPARQRFSDASVKVFQLIKQSLSRFFQMDPRRIGRYLEVPPDAVDYALYGVTDAHMDNLLGRGDFVLTADGELKCVEFNVGVNLGGWQLPIWENMALRNPYIAGFLRQSGVRVVNENLFAALFEHIIRSAITARHGTPDELNTAIVFPPAVEQSDRMISAAAFGVIEQIYSQLLKTKFAIPRGKIVLCTTHDLSARDNHLYNSHMKIDVVVDYLGSATAPGLLDAFTHGNLLVFNGLVTGLLANKLLPALLSEHENSSLLTPDERETIRKYIPWTRKTAGGEAVYRGETVNLKDFVLANREILVLKAGMGYGGKEVIVGYSTPEEQWREDVNRAFEERAWVVQEFIQSAKYLYQGGDEGAEPHYTTWGFFVFGNHYAGAWMRVLPASNRQGIINAHQGARTSVILEVNATR